MSILDKAATSIGSAWGNLRKAYLSSVGGVTRPKFLSAWADERQWAGGLSGPDPVSESAQRRAMINSWVYSAVNMLMRQISAADFMVLKYVDVDADPLDIPNHPLERLMRQPNPWIGRAFLWQYSTAWLELDGNFYWFLNVDPNDRRHVTEIWPLPSNRMDIIPGDANRFIDKYEYTAKGVKYEIPAEYIVHCRLPNPFDLFKGLSPLVAAMLPADADQAMARWNGAFFGRDNVMPSAVINLSTGDPNVLPDPSDVDRLKSDLVDEYSASSRKTLVTTANSISVDQLGWNMREMDFLQGRGATKAEIFTIFGVPMGLIDPNATEANAQTADRLFKEGTIWPTLILIAEQLTSELVAPFYGSDLEAAFAEIRPTDRAQQIQEISAGRDFLTIDEVRHRYWNVAPLPDGRGSHTAAEPATQLDVLRMQSAATTIENKLPGSASGNSTPSTSTQVIPNASVPTDLLPEVSQGMPGSQTNLNTPKAIMPYAADLGKWRNKALKNFKAGKSLLFPFDIPTLHSDLMVEVVSGLAASRTVEDVKSAFDIEPWKSSPRLWSEFEQQLHEILSKIFLDESSRIAADVAKNGPNIVSDPSLTFEYRKKLVQAVQPLIQQTAEQGVQIARRQLLNSMGPSVNWDLINQQVADQARQYTYDLVEGLTDTTRSELSEAVAKWSESGAPLQRLIDTLQGLEAIDPVTGNYISVFSPARARIIAVTETTRAFAVGNNATWSAAGVSPAIFLPPAHVLCRCYLQTYMLKSGEFVTIWYTVNDEHVCVAPLETPWGTRLGCKDLHLTVVSAGPYGGRKLSDIE